jgi:hypothetical protein
MNSLSQSIETRHLFERRPSVDPGTGANALKNLPHEDYDQVDALQILAADHIGGLRGLYRLTVLEKMN